MLTRFMENMKHGGQKGKEQTILSIPQTAEHNVTGKDASHSSPHGTTENH